MAKEAAVPEVRFAAAIAAFYEFRDGLAQEPAEEIRNGAFGIAEGRICFCDMDLMPDWVEFEIDVDAGMPISSKDVVNILDQIDLDALEALIATMYICGDGDRSNFAVCLRIDRRRRKFEPAFRALLPPSPMKTPSRRAMH